MLLYFGLILLLICVVRTSASQCKWLPGGPSLKWPVVCRAGR